MGCSRIQYRVYFINTRQVCTFEVREDEMQTIKLTSSEGSVEVDLPTGRITVDANVKPLAEYLTLTFAIGIIFVTMQKPSYKLVMVAMLYCFFLQEVNDQSSSTVNFKKINDQVGLIVNVD